MTSLLCSSLCSMAYLGINVAAFTEEPTLATAAWLDFKAHILRLLEAGHVGLARELWASVVEIDHHPALPISALSIEGMPPIKRMPCLIEPCQRCSTKRGGFRFPWIGLWTKRAVLVQANRPPSEAWRLYSESDAHLSFDEIRRASIGISAVELVPQHVVELTEAVASDRSSLAISDLFLAWRFWQGERLTWREPSVVSLPPRSWARSPGAWAGRALWGWLGGWSAGIYPRPACTICATQYWDTLFVRELPICDECRINGYDSDCSPSDSGSSS